MENSYYDTKGRARRVPSIEQDEADAKRLQEKKELGRVKNSAPGILQLSALADKWGTKLKKLK